MSETDMTQEVASSTQPDRPRVYAPWMIGVLIVFVVCEGLFVIWGGNALAYAFAGAITALAFWELRCNRMMKDGCGTSFLILLVIVPVIVIVMWPVIVDLREWSRRSACTHQLKQLGLGILSYAGDEGRFPPARTVDESGRPTHSWRALILSDIERGELYETYDLQKPWNSPENQKVVETSDLSVFQCPSCPDEPKYRTNYVAVVGDDTFWSADGKPRTFRDFKKDWHDVPMLIEIRDSDIPWHEPRDVKLDDILSGKLPWSDGVHRINAHAYGWDAFSESDYCRTVLFADGTARLLPIDLTSDQLRRLFSITEPFDVEKELPRPVSRPIIFRRVVFFIWLATLVLQFHFIFLPVKRRKEHGCTG